ncbi:protein of unknown function [Methylocaldum szegediense]|uniref:Secreted protein n=1 Tax=Methylocaldum szegediense TaxID=73780 RepID=A0ABM9I937_9GAMM|nr:protein of unknown function [Methylocaldum szegediense]CAI8968371.1 protein of unknown function [Methylocaldum szegediense]
MAGVKKLARVLRWNYIRMICASLEGAWLLHFKLARGLLVEKCMRNTTGEDRRNPGEGETHEMLYNYQCVTKL